jgi:TRAP transporter 4TM/12TM fusion protein
VEAVASTGGQIMPPVMGAAAFLMAELLGIPYMHVVKMALIPAFLYYASLFIALDFEAARLGLRGMDRRELPSMKDIWPKFYLLLPLILLVVILVRGYTPFRAAFIAIVATFVLSFFRKDTRFTLASFIDALVVSAKRTVMIAAACGAAGIVIGSITMTGMGLSLSSIIISLSRGNAAAALLLVMVSAIIMGMGTPTTVAYIVVSTLAVPVMKDLGYPTMASHMFVFFFAVLSMITPPVALAAYAAGDVAQEDSMKVGFTAMRIGAIVFAIPFVFLLDPPILMQGPAHIILFRLAMTLISAVAFAGAATGWLGTTLNGFARLVLLVACALIIAPEIISSVVGIAMLVAVWVFRNNLAARKSATA